MSNERAVKSKAYTNKTNKTFIEKSKGSNFFSTTDHSGSAFFYAGASPRSLVTPNPPAISISQQPPAANMDAIRRSPSAASTETLHDHLGERYRQETGEVSLGAAQYSQGYRQWLKQVTPNTQWLRPIEQAANPLTRLDAGLSTGKTFALFNQKSVDGNNLADQMTNIVAAITPTNITYSEGLLAGQINARYDPSFHLDVGTRIVTATVPGRGGWHANIKPSTVGSLHECRSKTSIPTRLEGMPSHQAYYDIVRNSELEHVAEIKQLYERHIVPYYHFIMGLQVTAGTQAECQAQLQARLGKRVEQAAFGFAVGDAAATRRYDDSSSTHHGALNATVDDTACSGVTISASQSNPQIPGREPGNVQIMSPSVRSVDTAQLSVSGTRLKSGGTVVHHFSSAANASAAMAMMLAHGIDELHSIGPFTMAFSQGAIPSEPVAGVSAFALNSALAQVSIGLTNPSDWVISQVDGDQFIEITNFGSNRDQAYSAIQKIREHQFTQQLRIGPARSPEFSYFIK